MQTKLVKDLVGSIFGRLVVVKFLKVDKHASWWVCKCICGNETTVRRNALMQGHTKSCGCLRSEVVSARSKNYNIGKDNPSYKHGLSGTVEYRRAKWLENKYGITLEQYIDMAIAQDHCCVICGINESDLLEMTGKPLCVDHNHKTGALRGLLCEKCNHVLGLFMDDINRFNRAIGYLKD